MKHLIFLERVKIVTVKIETEQRKRIFKLMVQLFMKYPLGGFRVVYTSDKSILFERVCCVCYSSLEVLSNNTIIYLTKPEKQDSVIVRVGEENLQDVIRDMMTKSF